MSISPSAIIHKTAVVEAGAAIGDNVSIGPFCHIGPTVSIGANSRLMSHVVMEGVTTLDGLIAERKKVVFMMLYLQVSSPCWMLPEQAV